MGGLTIVCISRFSVSGALIIGKRFNSVDTKNALKILLQNNSAAIHLKFAKFLRYFLREGINYFYNHMGIIKRNNRICN